MATSRSLDFLPDYLQTPSNRRFLSSTLDQLISEPLMRKFNGYVGREFAPVYRTGDNYIQESTTDRQNYQLEPSVVVTDQNNRTEFYANYLDILQQINFYGGLTNNHNRLFGNQSYSYNGNYDLDKLVNFSSYYWLPNGPTAVGVGIGFVPNDKDFVVNQDTNRNKFTVDVLPGFNPDIYLRRSGTYRFNVVGLEGDFWIQTEPTTTGFSVSNPNQTVRLGSAQGVINNGGSSSLVRFDVPSKTSQDYFRNMPLAFEADLATNLKYSDIANRPLQDIIDQHGFIDGFQGDLTSKFLIFVDQADLTADWTSVAAPAPIDTTYPSQVISVANRADVFQISLVENNNQQIVILTPYYNTPVDNKIVVKSGNSFSGLQFYKNTTENVLLNFPLISADLDTLYYVSASNPSLVGRIKLIDSETDSIDIDQNILGQTDYISPNGVEFTNGLKIQFDSYVLPESRRNQTYYVEGVGRAIKLVEVGNQYQDIDYFTINRSSIDKNEWSSSNRWFHESVIRASARYNNATPVFNQTQRAQRPIIEFDADLQLYNYGREFFAQVDFYDQTITDAFGNQTTSNFAGTSTDSYSDGDFIVGRTYEITDLGTTTQSEWNTIAGTTGQTYQIGDQFVAATSGLGNNSGTADLLLIFQGVNLASGQTIVFANDSDLDTKKTIYEITIVSLDGSDTILLTPVSTVQSYQIVKVSNGLFANKSFYLVDNQWLSSQTKTSTNQYPLFDIVDDDFTSFADLSLSEFAGTKIFSYRESQGNDDPVLGFPLSYKNINNLGDIEFENNYQIDTFRYAVDNNFVTKNVNTGFIVKNLSRTQQQKLNLWVKTLSRSQQYQQYTVFADGSTNAYTFNLVPIELDLIKSEVKVYVDNVFQPLGQYGLDITDVTEITFSNNLPAGTKLDVLILSNQVDPDAFYQIPINLENNSLNGEFETLTLGQVRNHAREIFSTHRDISGSELGSNNSRDLDYRTLTGTILQHNSPVIYAGLFLTHPDANIVDSVYYAQREYSKFKNRFLEIAKKIEFQGDDLIPQYVDEIMSTINASKSTDSPWYYSDMVPFGDNTTTYNYEVLDLDIDNYRIETIFDNQTASNRAVLVYLNGQQLILGQDYSFSSTIPAVTLSSSLTRVLGDIITIVDYNNTDGNFVPETPTKLGLYPKFTPRIYVDDRYNESQTVIQGHDGSITVAFGDYRDQLLLDLEKRIYNNIKTQYDIGNRSVLWDVLPGKFRSNDYSRTEFNQIISRSFLKWVGNNQLDYITNGYFQSNSPKTWNYRASTSILDDETLPGHWREIYRYFYDTDRPHSHPWEMLGFSEQPNWWEDFYGPAPYTKGNLVLWGDLEQGIIRSGIRQGTDVRFARPGLLTIIPVNDFGELRTPDQFLLKNFVGSNTDNVWSIGDGGPVETAWKNSSDYPFAMQLALALTRPADYFGLLVNNHRYQYRSDIDQILFLDSNDRIKSSQIVINGNPNENSVDRSASYINYIADYLTGQGRNGSVFVKELLNRVDVKLSYRMAGYSDKKLLKVFAEQTSPGSINDSILIPQENYQLYLHKSTPVRRAVYSSVIVRRTTSGYAVEGYDYSNPFFTIVPSRNTGNFYLIKGIDRTARIYRDFQSVYLTVPYGFEFSNRQQVVDFLISYQRYLNSVGYVFDEFNNDLRQPQNWELSAREFLTWSEQGWGSDSIVVLSPAIGQLKLFDNQSTVAEINGRWTGSRLLDQNFSNLNPRDYNVIRDDDSFELTTINARIIGLADLALVQYEHILILDNITDFDDVIYDPSLGSRQFRLKLIGQKTDGWNGRLSAPGFLYSDGNIPEWQVSRDYNKGDLVVYKNRVYSANEFVEGQPEFDFSKWTLNTTANRSPELLLNFASMAKKFIDIYDVDADYLDTDLENFSNNLIGFKKRDYFDDFVLENRSQVKFYQGFIKEKGTQGAVNALTNAVFNKLEGNIEYYEDWAIKVGTYGAVENLRSTEIILNEQPGTSNPFALEVIATSEPATDEFRSIYQSQLFVSGLNRNNELFVDRNLATGTYNQDLITAGFVDPNEVDSLVFDIKTSQSQIDQFMSQAGTGKTLWTARDYNGVWNVYRTTPSNLIVNLIEYGLDNTAEITTTTINDLDPGDVIIVKDFDPVLDGVYQILYKESLKTFVVSVTPQQSQYLESLVSVASDGFILKIESNKVSRLTNLESKSNWAVGNLVYVDDPAEWKVYQRSQPWSWNRRLTSSESDSSWGSSISVSPDQNFLIVGSPVSLNPRVEYFNISGNNAYKFTLNPQVTGSAEFGYSVSQSEKKLYVGSPGYASQRGYLAVYNQVGTVYYLDQILPGVGASDRFGHSVTASRDNRWLYVGAPGEEKVYAYKFINLTRQSGTLTATGSTGPYTLDFTPVSADSLRIYKNNVWLVPGIDYTIAGDQITFTSSATGSHVYYQAGYYKYVTYIELASPNSSDDFGDQIKTTTDGRQLAVSAPGHSSQGRVFVYDRTVEAFDATQGQTTFTALRSLTEYDVNVNGIRKTVTTDYTNPAGNTVTLTYTLNRSDRVEIETNTFLLISELSGDFPQNNSDFGASIDICTNNCSLYVGQPGYQEINYKYGLVSRFSNIGRVTGEILSGVISSPSSCVSNATSIRINDYEIYFSNTDTGFPTLDYVVDKINAANITGISAEKTSEINPTTSVTEYRLKIISDSELANDRIRLLPGIGNALTSLNLSVFKSVQTISKPNVGVVENFGNQVRINDRADTLVVGSENAILSFNTTFDDAALTFDQGSTSLFDEINRSGNAYLFELVSDAEPYTGVDEWQANTEYLKDQLFQYNQKIYLVRQSYTSGAAFENSVIKQTEITHNHFVHVGELVPDQLVSSGQNYGKSLLLTDTLSAVISKADTLGRIDIYRNTSSGRHWNLSRSQTPIVNLDSVAGLSLYNRRTNQLVSRLDYIDPLRGKVLGIADQHIDFKIASDPAVYNVIDGDNIGDSGRYYWSEQFVGRIWWNLDDVRYIEYQQKDRTYRFDQWAKVFPGSRISVYEWVESPVLPSQYVERGLSGIPLWSDDSKYTQILSVDNQTGILRTKYYFWVGNKNTAATGKNISVDGITSIIENPVLQDIPYAAILDKNSLSLYNCSRFLSSDDIVLRINSYSTAQDLPVHNEWTLIPQSNNAVFPEFLLNKIIDSLLGNQEIDGILRPVPDPELPDNLKYGIGIRPRQSVFRDRVTASKIFIDYINRELAKVVVVGRRDLTALSDQEAQPDSSEYDYVFDNITELVTVDLDAVANGSRILILSDVNVDNKWTLYTVNDGVLSLTDYQSYKLENYWTYQDWYAQDYDIKTIPAYFVDRLDQVPALGASIGDIVKVNNTGNGTWGIYRVAASTLVPVALQSATIKFSDLLYDPIAAGIGFDVLSFDVESFDQNPANDFRLVFRALRNDIAIEDLSYIFVGAVFSLIEFVFYETPNPDWVFKTSFIDIVHKLRKLIAYPSYVKDNQDYYRQYIEEVKPYKTKIRQYLLNYDGQDDYNMDMTDFDYPVYFDSETGKYQHPVVGSALAQQYPWKHWSDNIAFSLDSVSIIRPGFFYQVEPTLIPLGGDGTARLRSTVNNGPITSVTVVNGGDGFFANPEIQIIPSPNADGSLGRRAALLGRISNKKVRTSTISVKFDRIEYSGLIQNWSANTAYRAADFFVHNNKIYVIETDFTSGATFVAAGSGLGENYRLATVGDLDSAMKRTRYYYLPDSTMTPNDVKQLFSGVDYPGVRVQSYSFFSTTSSTSVDIEGQQETLTFVLAETISVIPNQYVKIVYDDDNYIKGMVLSYDSGTQELEIRVTDRVGQGTYSSWFVNSVEVPDEEIDRVGAEQPDLRNLDVIYRSEFLDTSLGTRVEDINVHGGRFVDTSNSHAPEELVPGRIYDTLEIRVFNRQTDNTFIGFRLFYGMNTNLEDANLNPQPTVELVEAMSPGSTSVKIRQYGTYELMRPITALSQTLPIVINGESMTYSAYDPVTETISGISRGLNGTIASNHAVGSFVTVLNQMKDTREYYRISNENTAVLAEDFTVTSQEMTLVDASALPRPSTSENIPGVVFVNGEKIYYWNIDYIANKISQIVRGVHGTGIAAIHSAGSRVVDGGINQRIPDGDFVLWTQAATTLQNSLTDQAIFLRNKLSYNPG